MQTSILTDMMQYTLDWLTATLNVNVSDETKTNLLRIGRLQSDPTIFETNLMIRAGGEEWPNIRATEAHHALKQIGAWSEIGGTRAEFWLRRFRLEMKFFFVGEIDQATAQQKANVLLSRTESYLLTMPLPNVSDSFGEQAVWLDVDKTYLEESGGPGNYIHRGIIYFEVLTERLLGDDLSD